jgi:rifampicin phosphotransferase
MDDSSQLIPLSAATADCCGNKAFQLARLLKAGLPVADGICLPFELYSEAVASALRRSRPPRDVALAKAAGISAGVLDALGQWAPDASLQAELVAAVSKLGETIVVRSSSSAEDRHGQSAAGLFHSSLGVVGPAACRQAITKTWSSLWQTTSWALLRSYGSWPGDEKMAVLIQRQIESKVSGIAHSDPSSDQLYLEYVDGMGDGLAEGTVDPRCLWLARNGDAVPFRDSTFDPHQLHWLRELIIAAEKCLGEKVQVEWAFDGQKFWLLQMRPLPGPIPMEIPQSNDHRAVEVENDVGQDWRWDAEHNPEPLSPAHGELIDVIDTQCPPGAAFFRIIDGYLFQRADEGQGADINASALGSQPFDLDKFCEAQSKLQEDAITRERLLEALDRAFEGFIAFFFHYQSQGQASLRRAFAALQSFAEASLPGIEDGLLYDLCIADEHVALRATRELYALATPAEGDPSTSSDRRNFLRDYGELFLRWDVSAPTLKEMAAELWQMAEASDPQSAMQGHRLASKRADQALQKLRVVCSPDDRDELEERVSAVQSARRRGEDDDLDFSRCLSVLRCAYLRLGRHFVEEGTLEDIEAVFYLKRSELKEGDVECLRQCVAERRAKQDEQNARRPPLSIRGMRTLERASVSTGPSIVLRGIGIGGEAEGDVVLLGADDDLLKHDFRGKVLVCKTLIPSLALILPQLAALISDHGGALSHAASLAREFAIPAVVGTQAATQKLKNGDRVWVDAMKGTVVVVSLKA